jgi:hypothetical protein
MKYTAKDSKDMKYRAKNSDLFLNKKKRLGQETKLHD